MQNLYSWFQMQIIAKSLSFCLFECLGDGGNDVSMIQAANVGVGIVGKVSKQALNQWSKWSLYKVTI